MTAENVHAHDRFVEVWIHALSNIIIQTFFVSQGVETFEYKLEECLQIFGTRTGYKDVGIAMRKGSSNS